jgi:hypothetical protein
VERGEMQYEAWTAGWIMNKLRRQPLLSGSVVVLLLVGVLSIAAGAAIGLTSFRDVGYPDSATLLRIGEAADSGYLYPDIDRPPYLVTIYGPLTYVLLGVPYRLAQAADIAPQTLVRLAVAGALCACFALVFLIARRLYGSRNMAWLCALFAASALPLASWSTQIRGDFLALAFALASLYLLLLAEGRRPQALGAVVCAGMAFLVKQTFIALPIAVVGWLIYKRRYRDAALWAAGFASIVVAGYAIVWWREPLMLKHIAALRRPLLEFHVAASILWDAVSQPVAPFAAIGGFLVLWRRVPEKLLILIYCVVAWLVAILTIPQVGGNMNYFWEPLFASAVLAGPGLGELQRKANRTPILVTAMLFVMLLRSFLPMMQHELAYLNESYKKASNYRASKTEWDDFISAISGQRVLSTFPDIAVQSVTPEIPDPYLNSVLERRGRWSSGPVAAQIDAGAYDLIVIRRGESAGAENAGFRGVRAWSEGMWGALKRTYGLACIFGDMEVWSPRRTSREVALGLSASGCRDVGRQAGTQ